MVAAEHSPGASEIPYVRRWIEPRLKRSVDRWPVAILTGARQVGKTTLLRHFGAAGDWVYMTLDDLGTRAQAQDDPFGLWAGREAVIIDEVQREPELLLSVKQVVDGEKDAPRFLLSGSANLLLMKQVSESLAGRAAYHVMRPFTLGEEIGTGPPFDLIEGLLDGRLPHEGSRDPRPMRPLDPPPARPLDPRPARPLDPRPYIVRGLMPRVALAEPGTFRQEWWEAYVATYLERDLRGLSDVSSLVDFRRVMQALALRTAQLLNQAEVSRDTAVPQPTLGRWLNLLEAGHLATRVPAFAGNRTKRILKRTKLHWVDPALPAFLAGHWTLDSLRGSREEGALFENLVYHHLAVLAGLLSPPGRLYHYREQTGLEIDFVFEHGRRVCAFEVKLAERAGYQDTKGLRRFLDAHPQCRAGVLVYAGGEVIRFSERLAAVPWTVLAS